MHKSILEQTITDIVIEQMETAGTEWTRPFNTIDGNPINVITGKPYQGGNWLLAVMLADCHVLGTYKQWQSIGAQVRYKEKGIPMFKYGTYEKEKGNPETVSPFFNSFTVFTANQVDNCPDEYLEHFEEKPDITERIANADEFIKNLGATITTGNPCYIPSLDTIQMPTRNNFKDTDTGSATAHYYSTNFHEHGHWTGSKSRLDRTYGKRFGDPAYAFEELVAELTACMLCNKLGIDTAPRPDHAKYLNNWLQALKSDKGAILEAAKLAQKAIDFMYELQPEETQKLEVAA